MPQAYEGKQPYIFVSYSHRDNRTVHRMIEELQSKGYRVWFDGGIEAGSEWPEYIASHLQDCTCVLAFISDTFVESHNCKRELNFAQELNKPLLSVYIEDVELTAGMRMQLGLSQALFRKNYGDDQAFLEALARAKILEDCRDAAPEQPKEKPALQKPAKITPASEPKEEMPKAGKYLGWAMALLELSYCLIGGFAMDLFTGMTSNGGTLFLLMLIPHCAIAAVNLILLFAALKRAGKARTTDLALATMAVGVVSTVLAVVTGSFYVNYEIVGILKFLISLGLNLVPAVLTILTYFLFMAFKTSKD